MKRALVGCQGTPDTACRHSGWRVRLSLAVVVLSLFLLSACSAFAPGGPNAFLGRYQRLGEGATIGEPDFLMMEYLEFRIGGQAVALIKDEAQGAFFRTSMWRYRILDKGRIEATGRCWRGWTQFDCTHIYNARLAGGVLSISDRADADKRNEYRRLGDVPAELPPLLNPPLPTPTPYGGPMPVPPTPFPMPTPPPPPTRQP